MTANAPDKSKRSRTRDFISAAFCLSARCNLIGERKSRRIAIEAVVLIGQGSYTRLDYPGLSVRSWRICNVA